MPLHSSGMKMQPDCIAPSHSLFFLVDQPPPLLRPQQCHAPSTPFKCHPPLRPIWRPLPSSCWRHSPYTGSLGVSSLLLTLFCLLTPYVDRHTSPELAGSHNFTQALTPFALHRSFPLPCVETQDDAHVHWPSTCLARPIVMESARKSFWVRRCQLFFFPVSRPTWCSNSNQASTTRRSSLILCGPCLLDIASAINMPAPGLVENRQYRPVPPPFFFLGSFACL